MLEMNLLFSTELVLDSMTTVGYIIESFYLLNQLQETSTTWIELYKIIIFRSYPLLEMFVNLC